MDIEQIMAKMERAERVFDTGILQDAYWNTVLQETWDEGREAQCRLLAEQGWRPPASEYEELARMDPSGCLTFTRDFDSASLRVVKIGGEIYGKVPSEEGMTKMLLEAGLVEGKEGIKLLPKKDRHGMTVRTIAYRVRAKWLMGEHE